MKTIRHQRSFKRTSVSGIKLNFSFKFFDPSDEELCPSVFRDGYTKSLMMRLKVISDWTVEAFTARKHDNVRNHRIAWGDTSRPAGFTTPNEELKSSDPWQFGIDNKDMGRVHGFLVGDTFYVVWLDQDHRLYPMGDMRVPDESTSALPMAPSIGSLHGECPSPCLEDESSAADADEGK